MILARVADGVRFVTQPDHAGVAGRLAERWGGRNFGVPQPVAPVRLAVHAHDDGWWPRDRRPRLTSDGSPQAFHELRSETWTDLYRAGIDDVASIDAYAGLLVSLHGAGLRRQQYGLSPSWGETPPAFREFVAHEERRQQDLVAELKYERDPNRVTDADRMLLEELHENGAAPAPVRHRSRLWDHYRLLVALDALSLRLCATAGTDAEPITVDDVPSATVADGETATVADGETASVADGETASVADGETATVADGETVADDEAAKPGASSSLTPSETTITATPTGPGTYRLDPYPFTDAPLRLSVPARTVSTGDISDEATLFERYYAADTESLELTLRRAD